MPEPIAATATPPTPPPWWHMVPDLAAFAAVVVLAVTKAIDGSTALMAVLAIQAGRLYPRGPNGGPKDPPASGPNSRSAGWLPSGLVTICLASVLSVRDAWRALDAPPHPTTHHPERNPVLWLVATVVVVTVSPSAACSAS